MTTSLVMTVFFSPNTTYILHTVGIAGSPMWAGRILSAFRDLFTGTSQVCVQKEESDPELVSQTDSLLLFVSEIAACVSLTV